MNKVTISNTYIEEQKKLHLNPNYGSTSRLYASLIATIIKDIYAQSLSDYGAGKGKLKWELESLGIFLDYKPYDPAFPEYGPPKPADLCVCIDVLEHVEHEYLNNIIDDLHKITLKYGFFTIHTGPAKKFLTDGRNAHLIQKPVSFWLPKLCNFFEIIHLQQTDDMKGFWVIVQPKIKI
jgi:hypothetical protein